MSLRNYLATFHEGIQKLEDYGYTESTEIREEIRPNKQAVIKGKIVLVDGSVLHIKEYIDAKYKIERVSYAYQYQDRDGELIFRYDNAEHHKEIETYPYHKHVTNEVLPSDILSLKEVIKEILKTLIR